MHQSVSQSVGHLDEREVSSAYYEAEPEDPEALVEVNEREEECGHDTHTHGQAYR